MQNKPFVPYHRPFRNNTNGKYWPILTNGPNVKKLEEWIQNFYDVDHVIACSSASIGLLICLQNSGNIYSYVDTPSFGWYSTPWAIKTAGYRPSFQEINKDTWLMNDHNLAYTLPVHTFGNITEVSGYHPIYDGAHAFGAGINHFGLATVISLAPTKMITAGEGGLILTNNHYMAELVRETRDKVSRMSEFNAFHALELLPQLGEILNFKRECYYYYKKNLPGIFQKIPLNSSFNTIGMITTLAIPEHIETRRYYKPLKEGFPNTEIVYNHIQCLPSWFGVDYKRIVEDILEYNKCIPHRCRDITYDIWS